MNFVHRVPCPSLTNMLSCEDVGDIEDCVSQETPLTSKRPTKDKVLPKALRRKTTEGEALPTADSFIPGTQSVYIKTWGCSHNTSDGEYMAGLLATSGYSITGNLTIINNYLIIPMW